MLTMAAANYFFLINFPEIFFFFFSFFRFFCILVFVFFVYVFILLVCLFFEIKNIYSDTHSLGRVPEARLLFWPY